MMSVLQVQILKTLSLGPLHGKELRYKMNWAKSSPSFYQIMRRMEINKLISKKYIKVGLHREVVYTLTSLGKKELGINLIKVN
jgi:DNA-binding PadR family transcriptional regulator